MAPAASALNVLAAVPGVLGRLVLGAPRQVVRLFGATGAMWQLLVEAVYASTIGALRGPSMLRKQLFPMMTNVGVRSFPIVALVSLLTGAVLLLQTGDVMRQYGQLSQAPGLVALSMTRELGPLMTAIVVTARVGASNTAVLGSMNINEEIMALRSMAIDPIGFLVAPRMLSMLVMAPCLVTFSYVVGMLGGASVGLIKYGIDPNLYARVSYDYLKMGDLVGGLIKAVVFGMLVSIISCFYGLRAEGGPTGLGRNIMVSVVTCTVIIAFADAILTAFVSSYVL
ncbi:MAG: MlaE family ABC transporter permease [Vicinamibacterales bacterium]